MKRFKEQNLTGSFPYNFYVLWTYVWWDAILPKNALIELYYNLSYETLSGGRNFNFEAISDLVADMSSQINKLTLSNLKRKRDQDKKKC